MSLMASQITSLTIVYSTVYSGADQRKHQSSASLAFVRGIHRGPVNSPHRWPVTRKMFPFDDVIMNSNAASDYKVTDFRFSLIWFMRHSNHGRVNMVVADALTPDRHQNICNRHDDIARSAHNRETRFLITKYMYYPIYCRVISPNPQQGQTSVKVR